MLVETPAKLRLIKSGSPSCHPGSLFDSFKFYSERPNEQIIQPYLYISWKLKDLIYDEYYTEEVITREGIVTTDTITKEYKEKGKVKTHTTTRYKSHPVVEKRYLRPNDGFPSLDEHGIFVTPNDDSFDVVPFKICKGSNLDKLGFWMLPFFLPTTIAYLLNMRIINRILMNPSSLATRQAAKVWGAKEALANSINKERILITPVVGEWNTIGGNINLDPSIKEEEKLFLPPYNVRVWIQIDACQNVQVTFYDVIHLDERNLLNITETRYRGKAFDKVYFYRKDEYQVGTK